MSKNSYLVKVGDNYIVSDSVSEYLAYSGGKDTWGDIFREFMVLLMIIGIPILLIWLVGVIFG